MSTNNRQEIEVASMHISAESARSSVDSPVYARSRARWLILIGLLSYLTLPAAVIAQTPFPQILNAVGPPACAASANMTAHLICVIGVSGNRLVAISERPTDIQFVNPAFTLDSIGFNERSTGPLNPLPLNVNGTVGSSSCAATADASADVVCAYNANGSLVGLRFSILANTQAILPQSFGIAIVGSASCVTGAARRSLGQPDNPPPAGMEGLAGETICAFRSSNNELMAVAFNPAVTPHIAQVEDLGVVASGDPSCVGAFDASNQVVCAFITSTGLKGIAFDPRPSTPFRSALQSLYAGTAFPNSPGCAAPNDGTGQVICAIVTAANTLSGFAFDPRTAYQSTLQSLDATAVTGTPSCSGFGDQTHRVICAVRSSADIASAIKFDPRGTPAFNSGLISLNTGTANDDLSCIFLDIHQLQANCGGVLSSQAEMFGVILHPPNPARLNGSIATLLLQKAL
jgi:hypothetical protein